MQISSSLLFGAVGGAAALALAGILVVGTLPLAGILALSGVLV